MKNDFGGHDNHHYDNIYGYAGQALGVCGTLEGHEDYFYGNKVVLTGTKVGGPQCNHPATVLHDNQYFTSSGDVEECGKSLSDLQKAGTSEKGSSVAKLPDDATVIGWVKTMLGITD